MGNNILLLIILLILFAIFYIAHNRKLGPSNLFALVFIIPLTVVIIEDSYFSYTISMQTIGIIVISLMIFFLGEVMVYRSGNTTAHANYPTYKLEVQKKYAIFALVIQLLYVYLNLRYLREVGSYYGTDDLIGAYTINRIKTIEATETGVLEVPYPSYFYWVSIIAASVQASCLHVIALNKIKYGIKLKDNKFLLYSVILFVLSLMFNGGRASFFPVIVHILYLSFVCFQSLSISTLLKKYKIKVLVWFSAGIVCFFAIGNLRNMASADDTENLSFNLAGTMAGYIGAPIVGLDLYVKDGMKEYPHIGQQTFGTLYSVLSRIGYQVETPQFHQDDFYVGKIKSNVYMGLCLWLKDFSIPGTWLFLFILGGIYGYILYLEHTHRISPLNMSMNYFFSYMYFSLAMSFFDSQYYTVLSTSMIYKLLFIYFIQKKFVKKVLI